MFKSLKIAFLLVFFLLGKNLFAQEEVFSDEVNVDDLGDVSDSFKDNFFNALSAKAIGNHDKAIAFLEVCEEM